MPDAYTDFYAGYYGSYNPYASNTNQSYATASGSGSVNYGAAASGIGGAVGTAVGAYMAAEASDYATKKQKESFDKALAFEKERDQQREDLFYARLARYKEAWERREADRSALLARYGM